MIKDTVDGTTQHIDTPFPTAKKTGEVVSFQFGWKKSWEIRSCGVGASSFLIWYWLLVWLWTSPKFVHGGDISCFLTCLDHSYLATRARDTTTDEKVTDIFRPFAQPKCICNRPVHYEPYPYPNTQVDIWYVNRMDINIQHIWHYLYPNSNLNKKNICIRILHIFSSGILSADMEHCRHLEKFTLNIHMQTVFNSSYLNSG